MNDSQSLKKKIKKFIKKDKPTNVAQNPPVSSQEKQPEPASKSPLFSFAKVTQWLSQFKKANQPSDGQVQTQQAATESVQDKPIHTLKKYDADLQLLLIPLILLVIFFTLTLINQNLTHTIDRNTLVASDFLTQMKPYPFVGDVTLPSLSAKAAIILDADSQVILFSKNPNLRFSMASTTKIMTALVALEHYKKDDILTVKTGNVEGAGLNLSPGEQFYFEDLLYAMLLPSANDAAVAIADNYPGGQEAFIKKMNEKAESLHLYNTHYSDPTGLDDDGDYTTVVDMAHLASYGINNKEFAKITGTKEKFITNLSYSRQYPLYNLNKLLGINGVTGIKTGTTEGAGEVLVTSTVENGHTYIIVVMNSTNRFADTQTLLNFISDNVQFVLPQFPQQ